MLYTKQKAKELEEKEQAKTLKDNVDKLLDSVKSASLGDMTNNCPITETDTIGQMGGGINKLIGIKRYH